MFLNFKEYSVLDHIKILSENPETFGAVKTANGESYDVYNITGYTVSVKNNIRPSTLDINIRNNETYETSLSYEYDSDLKSEIFNTPSVHYYKSEDTIRYRDTTINDIVFNRRVNAKGIVSIHSTDRFAKYTVENNVRSFETTFRLTQGTEESNITLQERLSSDGIIMRSVAFFRYTSDDGRPVMCDLDITSTGDKTIATITAGYRHSFTLELDVPDASLLGIFDPLAAFQAELVLNPKQYEILDILRKGIVNKLKTYQQLGGKMSIVNTILENIERVS
ncbi:hypothetical protein ABV23_RS00025 [Escherichia coli]|nr:hypothetical protein [Escherichia coli]